MHSEAATSGGPPGAGYLRAAGPGDETAGALGAEAWRDVLGALDAMGPAALERAREEAAIRLRRNGVTHDIQTDEAQGPARGWELDPVPFLLGDADWTVLEKGLRQRAELMSLLLEDLYGPRRLIREGLLPPDLVFRHAGFLPNCAGIALPGRRRLPCYAADLARGPDGRMWVVNDRAGALPGAGYALENRTIMAQLMPELFTRFSVHRLARFFRAFRAGLHALAPDGKSDPRIVLLTPGPLTPAYFEHAYLASYLGYTMVQGEDLTVRDGRLRLRTLAGLEPVDVVLGRVDQAWCDPLELRADSAIGVPGLVEAVRRGHAAMVNPLGARALENNGLPAFLPGLARRLLGEDLVLPSAATWWCGQPRECAYVLEHLERMAIRRIDEGPNDGPVFGDRLSAAQRERWQERIRTRPHRYVGQERVHFSTVPAWTGEALAPQRAVLRMFAASDGRDFVVMPGGLTRTASEISGRVLASLAGGRSRDTWVLGADSAAYSSLWLDPSRDRSRILVTSELSSRAAEYLFWAGRYAERVEGQARLARVILEFALRGVPEGGEADGACIERLLGGLARISTGGPPPADASGREPWLREVLLNADVPGSLAQGLRSLAGGVAAVRDRWSGDSWRVVREMADGWARVPADASSGAWALQRALDDLLLQLAAFAGLNQESLTRQHGWAVLDAGRRIERALLLVNLLGVTLVDRQPPAVAYPLSESVLRALESLITFRRHYRTTPRLDAVLELLLLDATNPRALRFLVDRLGERLDALPRGAEAAGPVRQLDRALGRIDPATWTEPASDGLTLANLDRFLREAARRLMETSDAISALYFTHTPGGQQLVSWEGVSWEP